MKSVIEKSTDQKTALKNSFADKSIAKTTNAAQSVAHKINTAEKTIDKKSAAADSVARTISESKPNKIKNDSDVHRINSSTGHQKMTECSSENITKSSQNHERKVSTKKTLKADHKVIQKERQPLRKSRRLSN